MPGPLTPSALRHHHGAREVFHRQFGVLRIETPRLHCARRGRVIAERPFPEILRQPGALEVYPGGAEIIPGGWIHEPRRQPRGLIAHPCDLTAQFIDAPFLRSGFVVASQHRLHPGLTLEMLLAGL